MRFHRPTRPPGRPFGPPPIRPNTTSSLTQRMAAKFMSRALPSMNPDERFAFDERVAICMFDGGLSEADATLVALNDYAVRKRSAR